MNAFWLRLLGTILAPLLPAIPLATLGATTSTNASGHWEGSIVLPNTSLVIRVDLSQRPDKGWEGTIDIPAQNLRGFMLSDLNIAGRSVGFSMSGIAGDPRFDGALSPDIESIRGEFKQSGQVFAFSLERKGKPADSPGQTPTRGIPGKGLAGFWQGSLKPTPVIELRLSLSISNNTAGELTGVMVSMDQGNVQMPITSLKTQEDRVHFEVATIGGTYDGKLGPDGAEISGEWKQANQPLQLVFKRLATPSRLDRPQEPKKPYPYLERDVVVENPAAGIKLAGTLTTPQGQGPWPGVVLITGSGPQDRDEALMGHRPFLVLADHLTRKGIVVLRCDDRGIGKSTGSFAKATETDFVADTLSALAFLKNCPDVDGRRLGLIGHSEGGIIAPLVAVQSSDVSFIVMLAGPGVPMEELLVRQSGDLMKLMGAGDELIAANSRLQKEAFRLVKEESNSKEAERKIKGLFQEQLSSLNAEQRKAMGITDATVNSQVQMLLSPWFREALRYDPQATLKAVKCPVLAINGAKDIQVAAKVNLPAIQKALSAGGNTQCQTVELPGLNHLFQAAETGAVGEYGTIRETMNPAALILVSDWILRQRGRQ